MGIVCSRTRRRLIVILTVLAAAHFIFAARPARAQDKNPLGNDSNAAKLGEFEFRANCAFCHGLGARGGGRGPDLTRARKRHGNADADLFRTINEGVPGTAMPPNGATQQGVGMTAEEIWQVISYIRSVQAKAPAEVVGNAAHGKEVFYGSTGCATCHMIQGKGGRLGPDLITADGTKLMGVVLNEDNFTLQMMDSREQLHLLEKDKLQSYEKSRESLMPAYDQKMLSDKDLQDLIAYLLAGGGQ